MAKIDYIRAFVLRGKIRRKVLIELTKGERTQVQIHQSTGVYRTHVRRALIELQSKGLIKCLNPKDRIYKIYVITGFGKKIIKNTQS